MEKLLEILTDLLPLWVLIVGGVIFLATRFYYTRFSNLEKEVRNYTDDTDIIKQCVMKFDDSMIDKLARKRSPRELTLLGKKILEITGANQILPLVCDDLILEMEQRHINTAFDAETEAYFAMLRNDKDKAFNALKNYIYNAPDFIDVDVDGELINVKLDYTSIIRVLSLNLRDEYIRRHPEIL